MTITANTDRKNSKSLWSGSCGLRHPHFYTNLVQTDAIYRTRAEAKAAAIALYTATYGE